MKRWTWITALYLVCLTTPLLNAAVDSDRSPLGQQVEPFVLKDFRGKTHSLDDIDSPLVVITFLGTECPLAKLYGPRLQKLHEKYAQQGVTFLGINANVQDSITEIAAYARVHEVEFPLLKDVGNRVADQMDAQRTPQVFVLDRSRTVRYVGRVDDQYGVGYVREKPQRQDLAAALDELLSGQPVSTPETVAPGCKIGRQREATTDATITYSNRIAHIFQQRCVECHREGDIAPFALDQYDEVAGWSEMIEEVVRQQRMPPWHASPDYGEFVNDRSLTEDEKQDIYQWVADGAPQGDPADLPEPREYITGWHLPKQPDAVFTIQDQPFEVKAEGEIAYQWFEIDLGLTEDTWVSAVEILPGNRAVVHHILAFLRTPGQAGRPGADRGFFAGYVPGLRPKPLPPGTAKLLPAGSKLAFQMHYTPVGSVQFDQSKIGLVYADPDRITRRAISTSALNERLQIPPRDDNYRVEATSRKIPWDFQFLSMSPHMHLRGKSFYYEAVLPDGTTEPLLDVPHYDFNWQTEYRRTEALDLPAGSQIRAVAHFDNSADNLNNPDPSRTVRWGDQTWDEMMIGYFLISVPADTQIAHPESELRSPEEAMAAMKRQLQRLFQRADTDGSGEVSREEAPPLLQANFDRVDTDSSGGVSEEEFYEAIKKRMQQR